jgi:molecular chaperone DnaK (HSP70)
MRLGIDFGTTRTVVAVVDRGNYPVVGFETGDGQVVDHWPTMLAVHPGGRTPGKRLYGWDALAKVGVRGWTVHRSLKRLLATARHDDHVQVGKDEVSVLDVVTGFLTALRHDVLHRSNLPVTLAEGEALEVMIAVPAGATSAQRFLMMDACRAAGFTVVGLLNEPSAAGVEYAHRYRKTLTATREDVLVYDLGGGTFDVSLVRMGDGQHEVVAHAGDNHLGGDDFDAALLQLAAERAGRDPAAWSADERTALLEHCRAQKERLTPSSKKVVLELDEETSVTVTTADYYAACEPLVARTLETAARVLPHGGDDAFPTLAGVYVTGGASDLPVVARKLKEVYGARVKRSAYASASTAVGLAIAFEEAPRLLERFSPDVRRVPRARERDRRGVRRAPRARHRDGRAAGAAVPARPTTWAASGTPSVTAWRGGLPVGDLLPWGLLRFPFDPALRDADLDDVVVTRLDGRGPMVEERYEVLPTGLVEVHITDLDSGYARRHVFGQLGA